MKSTATLRFSIKRLFILTLVSFVTVAALLGVAASANKTNRAAKARAEQAANTKSAINPTIQNDKQPLAPLAPAIVATLTDNVTAATKVAPGETINYTATITNNGAASPADDATNLNFSAPLDANTTLVGGSIHASPIAFNDTYNWVGNTQLDTVARALPPVTTNDVAVNAPAGTDTFSVTAIAGGATALGGTVTLASPSGAFTYTPPLGRPNLADGASVNDTFTYTITNNADPSLTSTGTVTIALTGRVWYLQAGAAGDGRSNTPSSSPAAMSTAADKSTDVFYIFSNAGSLNGPFTVDAGQQLLGQGVNLVVNAITLFTVAAPTPTTTNTAGNCVSLAGAPGNNTLSGFNIGNCTGGTAITGANVGTLNVSTLSINTNGGALDLTGVGAPTVSVVLGGTTSTGGAKNVNLVGLNGTITLASGVLSGATGNGLDVSGGNAGITFSGTIQNSGGRQVSIVSKTGGTVALSGAIGGTGTGIFLNANTGATINFTGGVVLSTAANAAFTATGGGTVNVTGTNTLTTTTGTAASISGISGALTFQSITANGAAKGISLNGLTGSFTVTGSTNNLTSGGTITGGASTTRGSEFINVTGGVSLSHMTFTNATQVDGGSATVCGVDLINNNNTTCNAPIHMDTVGTSVVLNMISVNGSSQTGINGYDLRNLAMTNVTVTNAGNAVNEHGVVLKNLRGTNTITGSTFSSNHSRQLYVINTIDDSPNATPTLSITSSTFSNSVDLQGALFDSYNSGNIIVNVGDDTVGGANTFSNNFSNALQQSVGLGGDMTIRIKRNTFNHKVSGIVLQAAGVGATSNLNYTIWNNTVVKTDLQTNNGSGAIIISGTQQHQIRGDIRGNSIGNGTAGSGAFCGGGCNGITVDSNDISAGGGGRHDVTIVGNTVRNVDSSGIRAVIGQKSQGNVVITGNLIRDPDNAPATTFAAIYTQGGIDASSTSCLAATIGGTVNPGAWPSTTADAMNQVLGSWDPSGFQSEVFIWRKGGTFNIPSLVGSTNADVVAFVGARNNIPDATGADVTASGGPFGSSGSCGSSILPPPTRPSDNDGAVGQIEFSPALVEMAYGSSETPRTFLETLRTSPETPTELAGLSGTLGTVGTRGTVGTVGQLLGRGVAESQGRGDEGHAITDVGTRGTVGQAISSEFQVPSSEVENAMITDVGTRGTVGQGHYFRFKDALAKVGEMISPTVYAQDAAPNAPTSGENVTLNAIATFPAGGKSITIKYSATVNAPPLARQVSTQGTVTANAGAISVLTDDPEPAGPANPTVTLVDTLMTWNGVTSTDWNTATNWTQPAGGTQYAPGVSNPAVNDVVIPNVGAQPNISATDIGIYSLNISNGRTLTITSPRVLTIGGSPGGDLTLDGIISGGNLNLGTGTHVINNAGGTGSLSSTNVATVLSGSTVTLNNNLQAGAVAVNAGGSMNITNRTLSLNGSGAVLAVAGGATFTVGSSTVVFNGTAAQQAAGVSYFNLTINNTIGLNVTGVTLTGNAQVSGTLTLTSSDLDTGAFTLTEVFAAPSSGVSDVVGTVKRTSGGIGLPPGTPLSFGNPNNQITFVAGAPNDATVVLTKAAPATYTAAVQRNYVISFVGGSAFTSATVRLHYLDSELNGNIPETSLGLRRLRTSDSHWVAAPPPPGVPTRDGAANWIEATGVAAADLATQWTFSTLVPTASDGIVTGRIVDQNGNPVEGAVVRMEGTQNRKFITDANGVYRFENVETSGFYIVTPSRANYQFNPTVRSFSQIGETTEAAFSATVTSSGFVNPLDTPEYFVRQHYVDFLGREPDESGFNFWSDQILECGGDTNCIERRKENVSAAYFLSIEFQQTGGLVDGLYRASYGTAPQFGSFMPDTRAIGLGVVVGREGWEAKLAANKEAFINAFVNRPAFHAQYDGLSSSDFVDALISHAGVSFTSGERDAWVSSLANGTSRADVLRSIAENERFVNAKFNEAFVMMEYFGYLRRDPDGNGFAFWLNKLNQFNGNFEQAEMVRAFIVSGEFRDRFPR